MRLVRIIDEKIEYWLCAVLYSYIIAIIFTEVFTRYILKYSYAWAVETVIYAFIWMCYIAMARMARTRSHLAFTSIRDLCPPAARLVMLLMSDALLLVLSVVIIVNIYVPLSDNILFGQTMNGVDLPLWIATAAVPAGWLLLVVRVVQRSLQTIREFRNGEELSVSSATVD